MGTANVGASEETPGQSTRRRVHIVPHTHWDREWYSSFQTFRLRLVDLLDDLLPRMEADPAYAHFLLDGQLAVVDDYLAVRPGATDRLRRLIGSGRIAVGPWYTLPDEFLVGGETLVRNLQLGLRTADRFGGAMSVGYLPDMFGHIAQMPQILAGFGFEHAVVWRGVPAAVDRSGFWWEAPDGTAVRAEYMPQGYGNGSALPDDAKAFVRAVAAFADLWGELLTGPVLWMNGTDHQMPQPWLGRVVAEANDIQDDLDLRISSLAEHLAEAPTDGPAHLAGRAAVGRPRQPADGRGVQPGRRAPGVGARRAGAARRRRAAVRAVPAARPLAGRAAGRGLAGGRAQRRPRLGVRLLDRRGVRRRPAPLRRGRRHRPRAWPTGRRRRWRHGSTATGRWSSTPRPGPAGGVVELVVPGTEAPAGTQLLRARPAEWVLHRGPARDRGPGHRGGRLGAHRVGVLARGARTARCWWPASARARARWSPADVRARLEACTHRPAAADGAHAAELRVLAAVPEVPGFGWRAWSPDDAPAVDPVTVATDAHRPEVEFEVDRAGEVTLTTVGGLEPSGRTGDVTVTNGLVTRGGRPGRRHVRRRRARRARPPGRRRRLRRHLQLVPARRRHPRRRARRGGRRRARTRPGAGPGPGDGPLPVAGRVRRPRPPDGRGAPRGRHHARAAGGRAGGAGRGRRVDNRSRDHRLRAHFPLPSPAAGSRAECAFGTVERGLAAEGGPTEAPLPTFPAQRFVQAGGLTVVHDGRGRVRAGRHPRRRGPTSWRSPCCAPPGMLSQGPMPTRPLPAGPLVPAGGRPDARAR